MWVLSDKINLILPISNNFLFDKKPPSADGGIISSNVLNYMAGGGAGSSGLPALLNGIFTNTQPTTTKTNKAGMN